MAGAHPVPRQQHRSAQPGADEFSGRRNLHQKQPTCLGTSLRYFYGSPGSASDQNKGDGSLDLKDNCQYATFSYNHFWDAGKASLCGMTGESGENWISYHHNWFDHSDSRHPRVRVMSVHVYNNFYDGISKYGVGPPWGPVFLSKPITSAIPNGL